MSAHSFLDKLNWRYATKKMDPSKSVEQDKLDQIIEAIRMAPTSSGTQPFELFVVTNAEKRADIRKVGWDQSPITEGSHLLVFAAWDNYSADRIDAVTAQMQDGALPAYLPDWITNGPVYLSRIKPRTPLQPNTFYRVSGHVSLGANRDLTDIAIAATGNIETGSNVDMKNVFLTAYGDISFNSNNDFGETDYCDGGTYDIHLFARGNISFGSNNRMRGMLMAAKGDITMLNNLAGLSSVHAEAGGIMYLKNASEMDGCAAALQSPFVEDPTDKFTVVKLVK